MHARDVRRGRREEKKVGREGERTEGEEELEET